MTFAGTPATPAEFYVRRCLSLGRSAIFESASAAGDRTIRASFLRDLLVARILDPSIAPAAIAIEYALVDGDLDCRGFASPGNPLPALMLIGCKINGDLDLSDSCWRSVALDLSNMRSLKAARLRVDGEFSAGDVSFESVDAIHIDLEGLLAGADVQLWRLGRSRTLGRGHRRQFSIDLRHSRIRGSLFLSGAKLTSFTVDALTLDNAEISGDLMMQTIDADRFYVFGGVRLTGMKVGGLVGCAGARIVNPRGDALLFDGADIRSDVFMRSHEDKEFVAKGSVRFIGAKIGGQIVCTGGRFQNTSGYALNLDGASIGGDVFMHSIDRGKYRFRAFGGARLVGTSIGGQLDCAGASLANANGYALLLDGLLITGDVYFQGVSSFPFEARGAVRLVGGRVGGRLVCGGHFEAEGDAALSMEGASISGDVFLQGLDDQRCIVIGQLRAAGINIGGQFAVGGALLSNKSGDALTMDGADIRGDVFFNEFGAFATEIFGAVRLVGMKVGGQIGCSGTHIEHIDGDALSIDGSEVKSSVVLAPSANHRLEVKGTTRMHGAKVGGQVICAGALFENPKGDALLMEGTEVVGDVFFRDAIDWRFECRGSTRLLGLRVGGQFACTGTLFQKPGGLALNLDGAEIVGGVFLVSGEKHRFVAQGEVRLVGARIRNQMGFVGTRFSNRSSAALVMEAIAVTGSVFFRPSSNYDFEVLGPVLLDGARIGGSFECSGMLQSRDIACDMDNTQVRGQFTVSLTRRSRGVFYLRGAHVGELADNGGFGWGDKPIRSSKGIVRGVLLRLDGFTYDRLGKWDPPPVPRNWRGGLWLARVLFGFGVPQNRWLNRVQWLDRQYLGSKPKSEDFFPQPHDQLTKVLQAMGHGYDARCVASHKFKHEGRCGADDVISRFFKWIYRIGFGCGYLPKRALLTVVIWLLLGWLGISMAIDENERHNVVFVRAASGVEVVRTLTRPDEEPKSARRDEYRDRSDTRGWILAPTAKVLARDVPCDEVSPLLYALDTMLPVVDLHMEEKCEFSSDGDGPGWRFAKAIYAFFGWIVVAIAALTWSGILRRSPT